MYEGQGGVGGGAVILAETHLSGKAGGAGGESGASSPSGGERRTHDRRSLKMCVGGGEVKRLFILPPILFPSLFSLFLLSQKGSSAGVQ